MGSTICTAGFPSPAIASSCFTARCASIWYGFFIATLLFSAKENCSQPIKRHRAGSRYFLRSTGHSLRGNDGKVFSPGSADHVNLSAGLARSQDQAAMAARVLRIVLDDLSPQHNATHLLHTDHSIWARHCLTACGRNSSFFRAAALTRGAISLIRQDSVW